MFLCRGGLRDILCWTWYLERGCLFSCPWPKPIYLYSGGLSSHPTLQTFNWHHRPKFCWWDMMNSPIMILRTDTNACSSSAELCVSVIEESWALHDGVLGRWDVDQTQPIVHSSLGWVPNKEWIEPPNPISCSDRLINHSSHCLMYNIPLVSSRCCLAALLAYWLATLWFNKWRGSLGREFLIYNSTSCDVLVAAWCHWCWYDFHLVGRDVENPLLY